MEPAIWMNAAREWQLDRNALRRWLLRRRRRARWSVRGCIVVASLSLVGIAICGSVANSRVVEKAAYLLHRAEASHRQLSAYQQLSSDVLEYIFGRAANATAVSQSATVERQLAILSNLVAFEEHFVSENGSVENDTVEQTRLANIRDETNALLAANNTIETGTGDAQPSDFATYETTLKPLLIAAVDGEQKEIAAVQEEMRRLQVQMQWRSWVGVALQAATVGVFLILVTRMVLDPMARLVSDIKEIGRDRLGHRTPVPRHDEFGLLSQHINRMACNLERGRRSLIAANSGLEAIVRDRTRALQERNQELIEIDSSRRRFFADVSHELRTPLTAIIGEADVTLRMPEVCVDASRDALSSILANSTYLNRRIDDLMILARSADGHFELDVSTVDLNLVAASAIGDIEALAKVNKVEARFVAPDAPVHVRGDSARLRQCAMVLLDSAVKASRAHQTIDVAVRQRGTMVDLTVTDRGLGIPVIELPMVFERYYQTGVGRRRGGTGLGLSIARRIVEAHGGTIAADRNENGGTVITMTFDRLDPSELAV